MKHSLEKHNSKKKRNTPGMCVCTSKYKKAHLSYKKKFSLRKTHEVFLLNAIKKSHKNSNISKNATQKLSLNTKWHEMNNEHSNETFLMIFKHCNQKRNALMYVL